MTQRDPWASVPRGERSTVRSYLNSDRDEDRDRVLAECDRYGLNYHEMRDLIMREMVEEAERIAARKRPKQANGLFTERTNDHATTND